MPTKLPKIKPLRVNPFEDNYLDQEIAIYGLKKKYSKDGVDVELRSPVGVIPDYFNKNFRIFKDKQIPTLFIDNHLWMSLTPMELQSSHLPILRAGGVVAVLGLGLGYYALRVMASDHVDKVHIFEADQRIVDYFQATFAGRPGYEKCEFHLGDARKTFQGFNIGYCFSDIYPTLASDTMLTDRNYFLRVNNIEWYDFWSQELILLSAVQNGFHPHLEHDELSLFHTWLITELEMDNGQKYNICNMYEGLDDLDYIKHALKVMERI